MKKLTGIALLAGAFGALGLVGTAGAVTPLQGDVNVIANAAMGISNDPLPPTILSSSTDSHSDSWTAVPGGLFAQASTTDSFLGDTVSAHSTASASWASADAGSMTFRDYGWEFEVNNPANTYSEADLNNNRAGPDWDYTFTTTEADTFTMTYSITGSGFT